MVMMAVVRVNVEVRGDRVGAEAHPGQHEGKFPHLKKPQPHGQRHYISIAKETAQPGKEHAFAHGNGQHHQQDGAKVGDKKRRVQQHAHGDEEEQAKEIPQGDDVAEGLVAVVGLAEDHAGDEGAKGKGEAEEIGDIAHAQTDGGDGQEEEFPRIPGGDAGHQPRDEPGAHHEHHAQKEDGLDRGPAQD